MMCLIIGRSGTGKDYLANLLAQRGLSVVKSYTTRPRRSPQEDTHIFIAPEEARNYPDRVATTTIGGYEYFTTADQIRNCDVYIIDPIGAKALISSCPATDFLICELVSDDLQRKAHIMSRGGVSVQTAAAREQAEEGQFRAFESEGARKYLQTTSGTEQGNIAAVMTVVNSYNPIMTGHIADKISAIVLKANRAQEGYPKI